MFSFSTYSCRTKSSGLIEAAFKAFFAATGKMTLPSSFTGIVWFRTTFFTVCILIFDDKIKPLYASAVMYFSLTHGVLPFRIWFNAWSAHAYFFPDFVGLILGGVKDPFKPVIKAIGTNGKK